MSRRPRKRRHIILFGLDVFDSEHLWSSEFVTTNGAAPSGASPLLRSYVSNRFPPSPDGDSQREEDPALGTQPSTDELNGGRPGRHFSSF